jgi:dihydrodipicolinate synthase/N-acetylneuraminate lyase
VDGNPAGIKYLLKLINICSDFVRLPLVGITEKTSKKLYSLTASIDDTLV